MTTCPYRLLALNVILQAVLDFQKGQAGAVFFLSGDGDWKRSRGMWCELADVAVEVLERFATMPQDVTLSEVGVTKKESAQARMLASLTEPKQAAIIAGTEYLRTQPALMNCDDAP